MNTDDLLCVGVTGNVLLSSTIGRNKHLIPGEVVSAVINGTEEFLQKMRDQGFEIRSTAARRPTWAIWCARSSSTAPSRPDCAEAT